MKRQGNLFRKEWEKSRSEKDRETDKRFRSTYGISLSKYEQMVIEQGGVCALCHRPNWQALGVDHSHTTGVVRRLLCHSCNMGLGHFDGNIERLETAIAYLKAHGEG